MSKMISGCCIFLFITHNLWAQSVKEDLDQYMTEVKEGSYNPIPSSILNTGEQTVLMERLDVYAVDTLDNIRSKAYYIVKRVGQRSNNVEVRQEAINKLIKGIEDQNTGISGNVSGALTGFNKSDFTEQHKLSLGALVSLETPHLDQVLKLVGYIEATDQSEKIDKVINSQVPFKYKWAGRLALARMGEQESIDYILNKLQQVPVNDNFVYDFVPDLVYTRQPEVFKFLERIIQSDEQNCMSADPNAETSILCGYRVMEYVAPVIEGYPLPTDEFGELMVEDYEQALQDVRVWLTQNPTYTIDRTTF